MIISITDTKITHFVPRKAQKEIAAWIKVSCVSGWGSVRTVRKIMLNIRSAKTDEFETLTNIAIRSEAYWGYDANYMEMFKSIYQVSEEFIIKNPTVVIEDVKNVIGFYGILTEEDETSLEYFFIDSKYIGRGYGKILWSHLVSNCKSLGIKSFSIVTSPQAKEFYVKMGATVGGEVESLLKKDRLIPLLIYSIT